MGLLSGIIKSTITSAVRHEVTDRIISAAVGETKNHPEETREETPKPSQNVSIDPETVYETLLSFFPKWTCSPVRNVIVDELDAFRSIRVKVDLDENGIQMYEEALAAGGFVNGSGSWSKIVDGKSYAADFSYKAFSELHYFVAK